MKNRKNVALMMGYYAYRIHHGIVRFAKKHGWILDATMALKGQVPGNWHGDGIISFHYNRKDIVEKIKSEGVPTVDLGLPGKLSLPMVWHDHYKIGQLAGEHLISKGFKNIGYINTNIPVYDEQRLQGIKDVTLKAERKFHELSPDNFITELKQMPLPIGIMVQNDGFAVQVIRDCLDAGFLIPEQVAIIGVDNDDLHCDMAPVTLTSVDADVEGIGYQAAKLLERLMTGGEAPGHPILVPPKRVVERASTNILAIPHVQSATALRIIWDSYRQPISLEDVAEKSGMCRRRLNEAFRQHVGRSMSQEILRLRLKEASRLLEESNLTLQTIAKEAGFSSHIHMIKVFKRELNTTPGDYRRAKCPK